MKDSEWFEAQEPGGPISLTRADLLCVCINAIAVHEGDPRRATVFRQYSIINDEFDIVIGFGSSLLRVSGDLANKLGIGAGRGMRDWQQVVEFAARLLRIDAPIPPPPAFARPRG